MQQIEYQGPAHIRVIESATLLQHGFISPDLVWNKENNYEQIVEDPLAAWLLAVDNDFRHEDVGTVFTDIVTVQDSRSFQGDISVAGEIKTGTFSPVGPNYGATFGGIEREARVFDVTRMICATGVINFADGVPRLHMPDGVQTDVYFIVEVEEWWLASTIGVYFEWVNDHSAGGNVRWDVAFREYDIGQDTMVSGGDVKVARAFTQGAPSADVSTTGIVGNVAGGNPISFDPGSLAAFYVLRISRLGGDAADTLSGPVGLVAASMTRGQ